MLSEDEKIAQSVKVNGWHAISVSDRPPPFVYTCGLMTTFGHPELIIFGLEPRDSYSILEIMVQDMRSGKSFETDKLHEGIIDKQPLMVCAVHPTRHEQYLGYAMGHCRLMGNCGGLVARQVLWPDDGGRFPLHPECDSGVRSLQPRLDIELSSSDLEAFRQKWSS